MPFRWVLLTALKHPFAVHVTMPNLVLIGHMVRAYRWRSTGRNWAPHPTFQDTPGHRNQHGL